MIYHFRNRRDREIFDREELLRIMKSARYVTLALCRNEEPYIVTLSCGYDGQTSSFYFHCANAGLKLEFIRVNPHVCATVIEDGGYIPGECGHSYRTVVFWGDIEIVPSTEEKRRGMTALLNQLETDPEVKRKKLEASDALYESMVVLKLSITEIHGKAGR